MTVPLLGCDSCALLVAGWERSGSVRPLSAVLAPLPGRMAEQACGDSWRNARSRLKWIRLAQSPSGETTLRQATKAETARGRGSTGWREASTLQCARGEPGCPVFERTTCRAGLVALNRTA